MFINRPAVLFAVSKKVVSQEVGEQFTLYVMKIIQISKSLSNKWVYTTLYSVISSGKSFFYNLPYWTVTANSDILNCSCLIFQQNEHSKICQTGNSKENQRNKSNQHRLLHYLFDYLWFPFIFIFPFCKNLPLTISDSFIFDFLPSTLPSSLKNKI